MWSWVLSHERSLFLPEPRKGPRTQDLPQGPYQQRFPPKAKSHAFTGQSVLLVILLPARGTQHSSEEDNKTQSLYNISNTMADIESKMTRQAKKQESMPWNQRRPQLTEADPETTQMLIGRQGPKVTGTCIYKLPLGARSCVVSCVKPLPHPCLPEGSSCGVEVFMVGRVLETDISCSETSTVKASVTKSRM